MADKHFIGHAKWEKMRLSQAAYGVGGLGKQKITTQYNKVKDSDRFQELWRPEERINFLKF